MYPTLVNILKKPPSQTPLVFKRTTTVKTEDYFYDKSVEKWAARSANRMSLKAYSQWGKKMSKIKIITSARYVQTELGIRLARELQNFNELPYLVVCSPQVTQVFNLYLLAFKKITAIPEVDTAKGEVEFSKTLQGLVDSCIGIVDLLAEGIRDAMHHNESPVELVNIQSFMDRFVINRIARRMLAEQHLVLRANSNNPDYVGVISDECEIAKCISIAASSVTEDAISTYGNYPKIHIIGDVTATVPFVVKHLEYILHELLNNSVTAVIEAHPGASDYPPIEVLIAPGTKFTTIRISDRGGGIPKENLEKIFKYGWTTKSKSAGNVVVDPMGMRADHKIIEPGLGFGLPLARLYAKHFGGDLWIESLDGYGTDVFLSLDKTGDLLENFEL
jgi:signal transduction histidine kinase